MEQLTKSSSIFVKNPLGWDIFCSEFELNRFNGYYMSSKFVLIPSSAVSFFATLIY